ncbi:hypothetical protein [Chitinophaga qingshengii]|uniref:RHS repeat-associated core domain-containing protein n=1 Tax=Chitinophaga qingshengii TaxID=1569794 RepID=A0ABR7TTN9_9BACT|nr:hypothetical protein [Chitinophaga qingshengii]MBC9932774.1 hypothetical protein [Chitinophaga qingshengii]
MQKICLLVVAVLTLSFRMDPPYISKITTTSDGLTDTVVFTYNSNKTLHKIVQAYGLPNGGLKYYVFFPVYEKGRLSKLLFSKDPMATTGDISAVYVYENNRIRKIRYYHGNATKPYNTDSLIYNAENKIAGVYVLVGSIIRERHVYSWRNGNVVKYERYSDNGTGVANLLRETTTWGYDDKPNVCGNVKDFSYIQRAMGINNMSSNNPVSYHSIYDSGEQDTVGGQQEYNAQGHMIKSATETSTSIFEYQQ